MQLEDAHDRLGKLLRLQVVRRLIYARRDAPDNPAHCLHPAMLPAAPPPHLHGAQPTLCTPALAWKEAEPDAAPSLAQPEAAVTRMLRPQSCFLGRSRPTLQ